MESSDILAAARALMESDPPVVAGRRFGPYEILSSVGAGGMGEVYRARDDRLDRLVALKVLAPDRSGHPGSGDRLRREARALSRLSHPNVCAVFDVGTEAGRDYLVMELLAGETLAQRLARGPLSLEQTLDVAAQIACGLETCHRAGLVHRDLKPANVMLTPSGVKLLDFGIARSVPHDATRFGDTATGPVSIDGAVVGTPQYMSPEQLEGREADARSDIFSFGAVLYEMVTGRRAFPADSPAGVAAAILTDDPASTVPAQPAVPRELGRLIRSCVAKDPADRWQSAHDLRIELGWLADRLHEPALHAPTRARWPLAWIAFLAAGVAAGLLIAQRLPRPIPERPAVRASIPPPENSQFLAVGSLAGPAVLSADGRRVAFAAASTDGRSRLWVRALDSLVMQPLPGTDGGAYPFWSPEGEQLAFFADGKLKKIAIASGAVTTLADARYGSGGSWSRDGTIVFAPSLSGGLQRVASEGGPSRPVTTLNAARRESTHRWPVFLPGGRRFIYAAGVTDASTWTIRAGSLDSDQVQDVIDAHSNAVYANGALLFVRSGSLLAQRVDERTLRAAGDPVPLAENILVDSVLGRAVFSASERGSVVYQAGGAIPSRLLWLDRTGKEVGVVAETCLCVWPRLSPDEQRVAVSEMDPGTGNADIVIYRLSDGKRDRLTFDASTEGHPAWTPDGERVLFTSMRKGVRDFFSLDALGNASAKPIYESNDQKIMQSVSGNRIVFIQDADFWLLPLIGGKAERFRVSEQNEIFGQISPNERWFLYQSDESGKNEVYVTSFPAREGKRLISENGGILPRWSVKGDEIFYVTQDHAAMFVAAVGEESGRFQVSNVKRLFSAQMISGRGYPYDVSRDGKRFLVVASAGLTTLPLTVVIDWASEIKQQP